MRRLTPERVASGFGTVDAQELLKEGKELGCLTQHGPEFAFQPLLRAFLDRKRGAFTAEEESVDRVVAFLLESESWAVAFVVIRVGPRPGHLVRLFELANA